MNCFAFLFFPRRASGPVAEEPSAPLRDAGRADDKAKERAIEHFADPDVREPFFTFDKCIADLYEILSPDAALRPFLEDYQAPTGLWSLLRNAYTPSDYADKSLAAKIRELLRQRSATTRLGLPGPIHELGPAELAALKSGDTSDTDKVLNLSKVLTATV